MIYVRMNECALCEYVQNVMMLKKFASDNFLLLNLPYVATCETRNMVDSISLMSWNDFYVSKNGKN